MDQGHISRINPLHKIVEKVVVCLTAVSGTLARLTHHGTGGSAMAGVTMVEFDVKHPSNPFKTLMLRVDVNLIKYVCLLAGSHHIEHHRISIYQKQVLVRDSGAPKKDWDKCNLFHIYFLRYFASYSTHS